MSLTKERFQFPKTGVISIWFCRKCAHKMIDACKYRERLRIAGAVEDEEEGALA
jgi:ribosomal protein L37AE/L43A